MNAYHLVRPLIFTLQPEQAHHITLKLLGLAGSLAPARALLRLWFRAGSATSQVQAFGLTFPNLLGMAAGYDKDAEALRGLACLGFGHIEVGTVTPRPQPGNPQPRLFRLVEERAVINRMGFNNLGAEVMAQRLAQRQHHRGEYILGVNIGKNKARSLENAIQDYLILLRTFAPLADYLAINISSPNTPGLRDLQERRMLQELLAPIAAERAVQVQRLNKSLPLLVKLSPDLSDAQLDDALDVLLSTGMDGAIISNTTTSRDGLQASLASESGGLSGAPLNARNTELVRVVVRRTGGRLPVVASGGVLSAADARAKLDAGAVLVQLYTGLIYEGPGLPRDILKTGLSW